MKNIDIAIWMMLPFIMVIAMGVVMITVHLHELVVTMQYANIILDKL